MPDHDDFAFEPVPGLPERPPAGEDILWQGRPSAWALAREALGFWWIAGYFALLGVWRAGAALADAPWQQAAVIGATYAILGALACLIVLWIARAQARATVYTITTARVAMRIGAALSVTLNLPFTQIAAARLDLRKSGTGTIALETKGDARLSYLVAWPHVRPWHLRKTEPALRCIADAARVASILSDAAATRVSLPQVSRVEPQPQGALAAAE